MSLFLSVFTHLNRLFLLFFALITALIVGILIPVSFIYAFDSSLTSTLDSVVANGSAATIITFRVLDGAEGVQGRTVNFTSTGELNTLSQWDGQRPNDGSFITIITDDNGYAITQLRSAAEGVKIVTATVEDDISLTKTLSINFTSPLSGYRPPLHISNPVPVSEESATNTNNQVNSNEPLDLVSIPEIRIKYIVVGGQTIRAEEELDIGFYDSFEILGETIPNGNITLYIYSEPVIAKVKADEKGMWSYCVSGITPGSHRIDADVKYPSTNKISDKVTLLKFTADSHTSTAALEISLWARWGEQIFLTVLILIMVLIGTLSIRIKRNIKH